MSNMNMNYTEVDANIDRIVVSTKQARKKFDDTSLAALAENIRRNGLNNRGIARQLADGRYELHAGERRLRALKLIKADFFPLRVFPATVDDKRMRIIALADNTEREDLTTFETAQAMADLVADFQMSGAEIAKEMGHNVSYVNRLLAPYSKLHPTIKNAWQDNHEMATVVNLGKLSSKFAPEEQLSAWKNLCEFGTFERPADAGDPSETGSLGEGDDNGNGEKDKDTKFRVKPALVLERYSLVWKQLKDMNSEDIDVEWTRANMQFIIGKRQSPPTGIDLPKPEPKVKKAPPRSVRKSGSLESE
jgi:ParB/RepB/Spo0J family partition protein